MLTNRFFVITGAAGSGKTALIDELKKRGYRCVEEVARHVIREQMRVDGDALPWKNLQHFKQAMLARFIETYMQAIEEGEVTIFDRDVLDLIAYDRLTRTVSSEELQKAVRSLVYNNKVFIIPPWEEIYHTDPERKQTFEEAVKGYENIVKVYTEYGRELIEVPKMSVEKRADFVISHIQTWMKT
jgi:predicted ATPase